MTLSLKVLSGRYAVCRSGVEAGRPLELPQWVKGSPGELLSITWARGERSVVCAETQAPPEERIERGWRCLAVEGPLDFALVGILAELSGALTAAGISLFAISTFDTDYLLVKEKGLAPAVAALRARGHRIT